MTMHHGGWRALDRAIQRDLKAAEAKGGPELEEAIQKANHTYATAGGAQAGALAGAAIGTFIPVVGTLVGGIIGGVVGGLTGHNLTKKQ
jgi:phage tail tape-measure protein